MSFLHAILTSPKDLSGLKAFKDEYPESTVLLLYRGNTRLMIDDILCIPCEDFLKKLNPLDTILAATLEV